MTCFNKLYNTDRFTKKGKQFMGVYEVYIGGKLRIPYNY